MKYSDDLLYHLYKSEYRKAAMSNSFSCMPLVMWYQFMGAF
jgi:hypothetical protein